jgi:4-hydroxybenzoate polyprenyltransferase
MIAVITILAAFPLGYFMKTHLAANVAYAIAYLWAFNYQTVYLLPDFTDDMGTSVEDAFPWDYGLVTLLIFVGGFGLVALGRWVRGRRTSPVGPVSRRRTREGRAVGRR